MVNGGLHLQYSKLHIAEFQDIYFLEWILAGVYIGVSLGGGGFIKSDPSQPPVVVVVVV